MTPGEYTIQLLATHLSPTTHDEQLVGLLQSWIDDGDVEDQKGTGEYLAKTLDLDRSSERKLFPSELKGVTW